MQYDGIEKGVSSTIAGAVEDVFEQAGLQNSLPGELNPEIEIPKDKEYGDLSSNIAMRLAKSAGRSPFDLAGLVKVKLDQAIPASALGNVIERIEVKQPGFINFFLSGDYLRKVLPEIKSGNDDFGRGTVGRGTKLQVEFVSANPTGPLTIAHGRQAAIGDSLANILEFLGYEVTREYYLNDEGTQMNILGNSIRVRYNELFGPTELFPADGYKGSYVADIAKDFKAKYGDKYSGVKDMEVFREFGLNWILDDIKEDLKDFGVKFDVWYSQKALRESGKVQEAISILKEKGYIYEQENAVWFKSTAFGDDKDRVVVKSDGSNTYLAPDIAYHLEKYRRGFKRITDIWGPDHHGYIPRMKAAIRALGFPDDSITVLIVQLATLYRDGKVVSMSTRAGEFVTLREVMDEVGKDVARFCFIMRRISSHLDFDLDVVKKESSENPVFYIQYAHARIWSILENCKKAGISDEGFDPKLLTEKEEIEILRCLRQFPLIVSISGKAQEPYVVLQYLQDLAALFHSFYNKHRVVSDDAQLTRARLALVDCVRAVLANGLKLLGVSLPKKM